MALTQKQIIPDAGFLPLTSTKIPITAYSNMNEPEVKPNTDESSCHLQANGHAVDIKNGNHEHHNGIGNHEAHIKKSEEILAILKLYLLDKLPGWHDYWAEGAPSFITVIRSFVEKGETVEMCLPAFPWKSANKVEKVLGILPDKAEEVSLRRLNGMCEAVGQVYEPGAKLLIISDGLVYNDLLTVPDRDVWAYGQNLRALAVSTGCTRISFTRLKDIVDIPNLPETIDEITYVANASNFRRALLNQFGDPKLDVEQVIRDDEDTRMTYCGYKRFLTNDLRFIFTRGDDRSGKQYKRDVKYLAHQMIIRGIAFAAAVKKSFPHYLRLSIHQSTGAKKVSINLLPTKTSFTTPWHCTVAFLADGTLISGPKGDFEKDGRFELVSENNRPSYFRETSVWNVADVVSRLV